MAKARKFKKKLAPKHLRKKESRILSVELIRKEYVEKVRKLVKRLFALLKTMNE